MVSIEKYGFEDLASIYIEGNLKYTFKFNECIEIYSKRCLIQNLFYCLYYI